MKGFEVTKAIQALWGLQNLKRREGWDFAGGFLDPKSPAQTPNPTLSARKLMPTSLA